MNHSQDLKRLLESIDHKGYPAYKAVQGSYDFKDYILTLCLPLQGQRIYPT